MTKGRCLGLLGGLGVGAAIHYYHNLALAHDERGRTLDLVMAHAETSRIFRYIQSADPDGMAEYLNSFLSRLQAAGAHTLIAREKLDAILIAGTDLALIFNESNTAFQHVDCAAVHIQAIVKAVLA